MIEVHYFASVRERLGCATEQVAVAELAADPTVAVLLQLLARRHADPGRRVLLEGRVLVAVNQVVAEVTAVLRDGDEVAFFPPVTGG